MHRRVAVPKKYEHINFVPPEGVANAAAKGLELRAKASPSNRGGLTPAEASKQGIGSGVQRAVNLKNRDPVSPKVIKQMRGFLSRSEKSSKISEEHKGTPWNDKGYVAWLLWGGDPAVSWVDKIIGQMEAADEKEKQSKQAALLDRWGPLLVTASENEPTNPGLWAKVQALAKGEQASMTHNGKTVNGPNDGKGFTVFPSAYANGWASKTYKDLGGGWKKKAKMPSRPLTPLSVYAEEILALWPDAPPRAVAAITEMGKYTDVWDQGAERAVQNVVTQMVQGGWRGPDAKRIRKELNSRLNYKRYDRSPAVKQRTLRRAWGPTYREAREVAEDLVQRGVDPDRTHLIVDQNAGVASFLLYNLSGQLVGFQQYRPDAPKTIRGPEGRYWTQVSKQQTPVWGLDTLTPQSKRLFIVEGIFDAAKLHRQGEAAVAILGNAKSKGVQGWLRVLPQTIIAVLDRDEAGSALKAGADIHLTVPAPHKDLGDMTDAEVAAFLRGSRIARGKAKKDVGHGGLDEWFSGHGGAKGKGEDATWGDWVSISPVTKTLPSGKKVEKGDIVGECGISDDPDWKEITKGGEDPLKCMPRQKAHDMPKAERADKAKAKQRAEKADSSRGKKPTRTPTFDKKKARLQRIQMKREAAASLRAAWGKVL